MNATHGCPIGVTKAMVQVHCQSFNGDMLYEPWEVLSPKGQPFTCFQDFWDRYAPQPPAFLHGMCQQ